MLDAAPITKGSKPVFFKDMRLRYRGQYDYDGLIRLLRGFFNEARISLEEPKFKFKENKVTGAEVEFIFAGDKKVTHYIKLYIQFIGHFWDVSPKEVMVNGEKKMMTEGKIEIIFKGDMLLDYESIYKGYPTDSKIKKKAMKEAQKFMDDDPSGIKYEDNKLAGKSHMKSLIQSFHEQTKKFLGMQCVE